MSGTDKLDWNTRNQRQSGDRRAAQTYGPGSRKYPGQGPKGEDRSGSPFTAGTEQFTDKSKGLVKGEPRVVIDPETQSDD